MGDTDPHTCAPDLGQAVSPLKSGRPEQGSLPPGARGAAQRAIAHSSGLGGRLGRGNTCSLGPPASDSCHLAFRGCLSCPVPSRPGPSASVLTRAAGGRESWAASLTGPGRSRAPRRPESRGDWAAVRLPPAGTAPPGVPTRRAWPAGAPASLTRPAAVGAHVAAPEPLRHGARFTCREPRERRPRRRRRLSFRSNGSPGGAGGASPPPARLPSASQPRRTAHARGACRALRVM